MARRTNKQTVVAQFPGAHCHRGRHDKLDNYKVRLYVGEGSMNAVYACGATPATAWKNAARKLRGA